MHFSLINFRSSVIQNAVPSPESRPAASQRAFLLSKAIVKMATGKEKQFQGRFLSAKLKDFDTCRHISKTSVASLPTSAQDSREQFALPTSCKTKMC